MSKLEKTVVVLCLSSFIFLSFVSLKFDDAQRFSRLWDELYIMGVVSAHAHNELSERMQNWAINFAKRENSLKLDEALSMTELAHGKYKQKDYGTALNLIDGSLSLISLCTRSCDKRLLLEEAIKLHLLRARCYADTKQNDEAALNSYLQTMSLCKQRQGDNQINLEVFDWYCSALEGYRLLCSHDESHVQRLLPFLDMKFLNQFPTYYRGELESILIRFSQKQPSIKKLFSKQLFFLDSNCRDLYSPQNGLIGFLFAGDNFLMQNRTADALKSYLKGANLISMWFGTFAQDNSISYPQRSKATTEFINTVERISYLSRYESIKYMPECTACALRLKEPEKELALKRLLEVAYSCGAWLETVNCSNNLLANCKSGQRDRKSLREIYWKEAFSLMQLEKTSSSIEKMNLLGRTQANIPEEQSWLARKKLVLSRVCRVKEISSALRRESLKELEQISVGQSSMETLANILACRQALSVGDAESRAIVVKMLSLNKQAGLEKTDRINNAFFLSSSLFSCGRDKAGIEAIEQLSNILSSAELDLCKRTWYQLIAKSLEEEGKDAQALALYERGLALPTLGPAQKLGYTLLKLRCQRNLEVRGN